jgi:hypothetical protein
MIAAIRLAMAHLRVLLVTDPAAGRRPALLREPFFLAGASSGGVLDACLRELALPLIDRRRLIPDPVAYQVVLPDARVSVGSPSLTAEELVAWRLAKPEFARTLVRDLLEGGAAELAALLETSVVRVGGLRSLVRGRSPARPPRYARGLPREVADPPLALAPFFEAQIRAQVNVPTIACPPEARARLLGAPLKGGSHFASDQVSLRSLLEKRFTTLHGEIRAAPGKFELVHVDNHPGLAIAGSGEVWLGRALVLNAPLTPLVSWMEQREVDVPRFLQRGSSLRRRICLLLRAHREVVPEGMARRVIRVGDARAPLEGTNVVSLSVFPTPEDEELRLVVSALLPEEAEAREAAPKRLEAAVRELMPFAEDRLGHVPVRSESCWEDDDALEDPSSGGGWPTQSELRLSARPPVYRLAREDVGVLGLEGDVLLGWHAGDALRHELQ